MQEITLKQWFLLVMIHHINKKQPSITEVAACIGSTRQNVRKMLEVLSANGYVQLTANPYDKGTAFLEQFFNGTSSELLESSRQTFEALFQNMDRMENSDEKNSNDL